jgi:molybdopterin converting factor small subunit
MAEAILRLNGLVSPGKDNNCSVSFENQEIQLEMLLTLVKTEIHSRAIAFVAVNGTRVSTDSMIKDGDIIDIFPVVAGG